MSQHHLPSVRQNKPEITANEKAESVMAAKMNEEIKAEWTRRLRSGEYQKGTGTLRTKDDKYCCLGVLCEIAVDKGIIARVFNQDTYSYGHYGSYLSDLRSGVLPPEVIEWSGVDSHGYYGDQTSQFDDGEAGKTLVNLNDSQDKSFAEIADVIEEML